MGMCLRSSQRGSKPKDLFEANFEPVFCKLNYGFSGRLFTKC